MVTAVHGGQDHRLKSPFLTKKDDPEMPSIYCSINGYNFYKTTCDTGSGVHITAAVIYRLLFGAMPLKPTYIHLQMADQTFRKVKGTVADVPVKIDDHFVYTDFQVICNTPGVCHLLGTRFELKHDKFNGNKKVKVNL